MDYTTGSANTRQPHRNLGDVRNEQTHTHGGDTGTQDGDDDGDDIVTHTQKGDSFGQ
jgi:hypothetical protein